MMFMQLMVWNEKMYTGHALSRGQGSLCLRPEKLQLHATGSFFS